MFYKICVSIKYLYEICHNKEKKNLVLYYNIAVVSINLFMFGSYGRQCKRSAKKFYYCN